MKYVQFWRWFNDASLQKQTLAEQAKQNEEARRKALKRAMARQNALRGAGASGMLDGSKYVEQEFRKADAYSKKIFHYT